MKRTNLIAIFLVALCAMLLSTCVEEETPTEPGAGSTSLTGTLQFPPGSGIAPEEVYVVFGESETRPASDGSFDVVGRNGIPAMAIAYDKDEIPLLMAFVPDPEYQGSLTLNARSTAVGLSFLVPFICSSDPDAVGEILYTLNRLTELDQLEQLLEQKLSSDPRALAQDDAEISSALTNLVVAFLNEVPTPVLPGGSRAPSSPSDEIVIDPGNIVSGHQVISLGGPDFDISNWYGRWAYCITPSEEFFLQPNGSLADILKLGQPWAPSTRRFQMVVEPNKPPKQVTVFGLGWDSDATNLWSTLSEQEQQHAMNAGVATVAFELVPHTICVLTGASGTIGKGTIAKAEVAKVLGRVFGTSANLYKIKTFVQEKNYWGLAWHVSKVLLEEIVQNEDFRRSFLKLFGISLAEGKLKSIAAALNFGARVFFVGDALTSFAKTWVGVFLSRFQTTFAISRQQIEYGKIQGSVHDGESGLPIPGATVNLRGDEGNPLNPTHTFTTLADGSFYFENIMVGEKTLEASKEGYGPKSVPVTVNKDQTTSVTISLRKSSGKVTGSVINEILQKKGVFPATFQGDYHLDVVDNSTGNVESSLLMSSGIIALELPPGEYRLVVWHEDYNPDSTVVTVRLNSTTQASDLVLRPHRLMKGTVSVTMGGGWTQQPFETKKVSARITQSAAVCPGGANPQLVVEIVGLLDAPAEALGIEIVLTRCRGSIYDRAIQVPEHQRLPAVRRQHDLLPYRRRSLQLRDYKSRLRHPRAVRRELDRRCPGITLRFAPRMDDLRMLRHGWPAAAVWKSRCKGGFQDSDRYRLLRRDLDGKRQGQCLDIPPRGVAAKEILELVESFSKDSQLPSSPGSNMEEQKPVRAVREHPDDSSGFQHALGQLRRPWMAGNLPLRASIV
jgi:hypothetical protein